MEIEWDNNLNYLHFSISQAKIFGIYGEEIFTDSIINHLIISSDTLSRIIHVPIALPRVTFATYIHINVV
jgi:hypothetical protein